MQTGVDPKTTGERTKPMTMQDIKATIKTGDLAGKEITVKFDMPETLAEKVEKFGEDKVNQAAKSALTVSLQSFLRGKIEQGDSLEDTQKAVNEWKPGAGRKVTPPSAKVNKILEKLTPEQRAAILAELAGGDEEAPSPAQTTGGRARTRAA